MSVLDGVVNFGKVAVSIGYDAAATSIVLSSGDGAKLPDPSTANYNLVWWNVTDYVEAADDPNKEIVRVTAKSTDTLTVTRAQESTSASTKNTAGKTYRMELALTAKMITDIESNFATKTGTETISNKTLDESNQTVGSPLNAQTGTTYTFVLTDAGKICTFANASAVTVTVPPNSSVAFPVGTRIDCAALGAGKVSFAAGSGVTINSDSGNLAIGVQYGGVTLFQTATDTWVLLGNLQA